MVSAGSIMSGATDVYLIYWLMEIMQYCLCPNVGVEKGIPLSTYSSWIDIIVYFTIALMILNIFRPEYR